MGLKKLLFTLIILLVLSLGVLQGCSKKDSSDIEASAVLNSECARSAIAMAIDKKTFVDTILNNGSIPANYYVPRYLAINDDGKDYRDIAGDIGYSYDLDKAKSLWEQAKAELGFKHVSLDVVLSDTDFNRKLGEYLKSELEQLDGLSIDLRQMPEK